MQMKFHAVENIRACNYYLTVGQRGERQQEGQDRSRDAEGGAGGQMEGVHDGLSLGTIDESYNINKNSLAKGYTLRNQVSVLREHHHESAYRHHRGGGGGGEPGRPDEPQAEDAGANPQHRRVHGQPAAAQCVAQCGVGDNENHRHVGEGRERHLAADVFGAVEGGDAHYGACQGGAEGGGEAAPPHGSSAVVILGLCHLPQLKQVS